MPPSLTGAPECATQETETETSIPRPQQSQRPRHSCPEPASIELPVTNEDARTAANFAGAAARAKRNGVNAQAPSNRRPRSAKTDERACAVGAKGEEKVANEPPSLARSGVLHAVEVGQNGSDIDHVVIGPPGVITLNAKRHPRGKVWVGERMVMINGQKTDYP